MPAKFGYCNNKNVRSGGEANVGSLHETKWMQEIERHLGGRESSILKQDERKKLLRDMPPPTFRPPLSSTDVVKPIFFTTHILKEFMKCGIIA